MTAEERGAAGRKPPARSRLATAVVAIGLILLKWGKFLLLGLKSTKVLTSAATMLVSMVVYATIFGAPYAVGFVLLILLHEMGHFLAARQRGLAVGAPTFIPFFGAWIQLKAMPHDVETEAYVGIAGPVFGTVASLACYGIARLGGGDLFLALAYSGFFINLFNLLPLSPLDGGRVTAIVSPRIWLLGAPLLIALFFYRPNPMLIVVAILAIPSLIKAWRYDPADPKNAAYYGVSPTLRIQYGIAYLALIVFLAVMMQGLHGMLGHLR